MEGSITGQDGLHVWILTVYRAFLSAMEHQRCHSSTLERAVWTPVVAKEQRCFGLWQSSSCPDLCTVLEGFWSASVCHANWTIWQKVTRIGLPPPGIHAMPTPVSTLAFDTQQELLWTGNEYVSCIC